jgi:hypothetical protein
MKLRDLSIAADLEAVVKNSGANPSEWRIRVTPEPVGLHPSDTTLIKIASSEEDAMKIKDRLVSTVGLSPADDVLAEHAFFVVVER